MFHSSKVLIALIFDLTDRRPPVLQVQNEEIKQLQEVAKNADIKRTDYEEVTLLVKRFWDRLIDDVVFLCKQASPSEVGSLSCLAIVSPPMFSSFGNICDTMQFELRVVSCFVLRRIR